jgi:uncharacterized glyoxalase superfamily protein PhnB
MTERIIYNLEPLLQVRDLPATVAFWRDVLGFRVNGMFPDDAPTWCGMQSGNARIMFSSFDGVDASALTGTIYLYPDDIDATWEMLKDSVPVVEPLHLTAYGMREFAIRDPNGFVLSFGASSDHEHEHEHAHEHEHPHER